MSVKIVLISMKVVDCENLSAENASNPAGLIIYANWTKLVEEFIPIQPF